MTPRGRKLLAAALEAKKMVIGRGHVLGKWKSQVGGDMHPSKAQILHVQCVQCQAWLNLELMVDETIHVGGAAYRRPCQGIIRSRKRKAAKQQPVNEERAVQGE